MTVRRLLCAGLMGLAVAAATPAFVSAQNVRVVTGATSGMLNVATNRAVVVESDEPFSDISIANPGIADISTLSDRTIYVLGKAPGRTTLTLLSPDGRLITNVDVQVSPDVAEFKERLQQILPGEGIEVRTANDGIVLSGVVSSTARLDRALDLAERYAPGRVSNLMNVGGTQQVMLKVRFAEVARSVSKSFDASFAFNGVIFNGTTPITGATGALADQLPSTIFDPNTPTQITGDAAGALGTVFGTGAVQFGILLEALENKGLARVLSEPNLVALSGQEAEFLAGGEVPIPVVDDDGGITVEFKPFGVQLLFTPTVVDGDIINLELGTAVSAIDPTVVVQNDGFLINGFSRREAKTTVEMRDGESFAIAGLLEDDFRDAIGQVPWLGDLPVLGSLFRSTNYQREQSELVIIITPHLVTPTRGEALALPTDRISIPTERSLFWNGNLAGNQGSGSAVAEVAKQDFSGSYGYVME
ncbi:MAG: type II and III secretion system protein family protein [Pseudomonadota bacterium]